MQTPTCTIRSEHDDVRRIIVIEADPDLRKRMVGCLQDRQYEVTGAASAIELYRLIAGSVYDLAIIDASLPDQDGLVLAQYLRTNTAVRILLLMDHESIQERIVAYEAGADLVMVKSVDLRELAASSAGLMQRLPSRPLQPGEPAVRNEDAWSLVTSERLLLTPAGRHVSLTPQEFGFLECLALDPEEGAACDSIIEVLGFTRDRQGRRSLQTMVNRLRNKISRKLETPIRSVSGIGYRFLAPMKVR